VFSNTTLNYGYTIISTFYTGDKVIVLTDYCKPMIIIVTGKATVNCCINFNKLS